MCLGNKVKTNLNDLGNKLTDKCLGKKAYWKIVNTLKNKCKIPRIPPLLVAGKFITNCKEKANLQFQIAVLFSCSRNLLMLN